MKRSRIVLPGQKGWGKVITPDIRLVGIADWGRDLKSSHVLHPGKIAVAETTPQIIGHGGMIPLISARSVLARHGVEVKFDQSQVPDLLSGKLPSRVMLVHSGRIPVQLRRGNRTHRVYYQHVPEGMRKHEIRERLERGDLKLGNDFKILPNGILELKVHPVFYRISPEEIRKAARKNWVSGSKRLQFMQHFERVRGPMRTEQGVVVLTETKPVKLPPDIGMLLQGSTDGRSRHIHSLFIDPKFEGPIVLEIQGIDASKRAEPILVRLVKMPRE